MKKLPKYFAVLEDRHNPLWDKYIQWLNKTYNSSWHGDTEAYYYGYNGKCFMEHSLDGLLNNPEVITLEYWNECVNGFKLPEKWCIKNSPEIDLVIGEWFDKNIGRIPTDKRKDAYWHYPEISKYTSSDSRINAGYTEITFEQFKEYVLKQDNMEKKIIGYELKPKFKHMRRAVEEITNFSNSGDSEEYFTNYFKSSLNLSSVNFAKTLKEAGVLDLWFEPVYENEFKVGDWVLLSDNANGWGSSVEAVNNRILQITKIDLADRPDEGGRYYFRAQMTVGNEIVRKATPEEISKAMNPIPDITIKGYKAEFTKDSVTFGCQTYSKEFVLTLAKCLEDNGFDMEIGDEVIEIAEYFKSL